MSKLSKGHQQLEDFERNGDYTRTRKKRTEAAQKALADPPKTRPRGRPIEPRKPTVDDEFEKLFAEIADMNQVGALHIPDAEEQRKQVEGQFKFVLAFKKWSTCTGVDPEASRLSEKYAAATRSALDYAIARSYDNVKIKTWAKDLTGDSVGTCGKAFKLV